MTMERQAMIVEAEKLFGPKMKYSAEELLAAAEVIRKREKPKRKRRSDTDVGQKGTEIPPNNAGISIQM